MWQHRNSAAPSAGHNYVYIVFHIVNKMDYCMHAKIQVINEIEVVIGVIFIEGSNITTCLFT